MQNSFLEGSLDPGHTKVQRTMERSNAGWLLSVWPSVLGHQIESESFSWVHAQKAGELVPWVDASQHSSHRGTQDGLPLDGEAPLPRLCAHTCGLLVETWPGTHTARAQLPWPCSISVRFRAGPWILLMLPFSPVLDPLIQTSKHSSFIVFAVFLLLYLSSSI